MNNRRTPHAVALVLSVFITLTIFSGVTSLSAPEHGAALLAQVAAATHS